MNILVAASSDIFPVNGGSRRILALAAACRDLGHDVYCVYPSSGQVEPVTSIELVPIDQKAIGQRSWPDWILAAKRRLLPMPTRIGATMATFTQTLDQLPKIDLAILPGGHARRWFRGREDICLWMDYHDAWSRFAERHGRGGPALSRIGAEIQSRLLRRVERSDIESTSIQTAAGRGDAEYLSSLSSRAVTYLPSPVEGPRQRVPFPGTRTLGFLATFTYPPNRDAADLLVRHWYPSLVRAGWKLIVAGNGSDRLKLPPEIVVLGQVPDLVDFYARIDGVVAPIRLGGGMKHKVIEALCFGRPVIATKFALDGFGPLNGTYEVAEERPAIPVDLPALDDLEWEALREAFSLERFRECVEALLSQLVSSRGQ